MYIWLLLYVVSKSRGTGFARTKRNFGSGMSCVSLSGSVQVNLALYRSVAKELEMPICQKKFGSN